jgi:hypothetical protein
MSYPILVDGLRLRNFGLNRNWSMTLRNGIGGSRFPRGIGDAPQVGGYWHGTGGVGKFPSRQSQDAGEAAILLARNCLEPAVEPPVQMEPDLGFLAAHPW